MMPSVLLRPLTLSLSGKGREDETTINGEICFSRCFLFRQSVSLLLHAVLCTMSFRPAGEIFSQSKCTTYDAD
jgi:hypothetical protein